MTGFKSKRMATDRKPWNKSKSCTNCRYSTHLVDPVWSEEFEQYHQQEVDNHQNYEPYKWMTSYFWRTRKAEYQDKVVYNATHLECRRFPRFEEKRDDDLCGEWKAVK